MSPYSDLDVLLKLCWLTQLLSQKIVISQTWWSQAYLTAPSFAKSVLSNCFRISYVEALCNFVKPWQTIVSNDTLQYQHKAASTPHKAYDNNTNPLAEFTNRTTPIAKLRCELCHKSDKTTTSAASGNTKQNNNLRCERQHKADIAHNSDSKAYGNNTQLFQQNNQTKRYVVPQAKPLIPVWYS